MAATEEAAQSISAQDSIDMLLPTVTRPELLVNGSDSDFRTLIHRLMSFARCISSIRDGFGALGGISGVQYEILMRVSRLAGEEGVTVGDLSAVMRQSGAFTTIETGKLVEKGLLEKSPDLRDRRKVRLRLTEEGRKTLSSLTLVQQQINDTLFASIKPNELQTLSGIVRDLLPCADQASNLIEFMIKRGQLQPNLT